MLDDDSSGVRLAAKYWFIYYGDVDWLTWHANVLPGLIQQSVKSS